MINLFKKMVLLTFFVSGIQWNLNGAVPCGSTGILNVGILSANQPYSDFDPVLNQPFGFDVDLICAIARLLGYQINFVFVASLADAQGALAAGTIDVYANSATPVTALVPLNGAVITDISQTTNPAAVDQYRGYIFEPICCSLMNQFDAAITALVENGTYADILQKQRQDPRIISTAGLGYYATPLFPIGILVEPREFNSSMAGTIPQIIGLPTGATGCRAARAGLPATTCLSEFVIANSSCTFTFTGPTGGISS